MHRHHEKTVGEVTMEHAVAILASHTRAGLHQLAGDDPELRLVTLAGFLCHLCQVQPDRREKMRGLLATVSEAVTADEPQSQEAPTDA